MHSFSSGSYRDRKDFQTLTFPQDNRLLFFSLHGISVRITVDSSHVIQPLKIAVTQDGGQKSSLTMENRKLCIHDEVMRSEGAEFRWTKTSADMLRAELWKTRKRFLNFKFIWLCVMRITPNTLCLNRCSLCPIHHTYNTHISAQAEKIQMCLSAIWVLQCVCVCVCLSARFTENECCVSVRNSWVHLPPEENNTPILPIVSLH